MQSDKRLIVLKFGSSVLNTESDLPTVVHEIYRWWREGHQVIAVVSALGNTTDDLSLKANQACDEPDEKLVATLLATGETSSSALLGLALNRSGIPATVLNAEQAGLRTTGAILDSDLIDVDTIKVNAALREGIVVLPGFVGFGPTGETTLLGRGGSDLTALFLAKRLGGVCRLIKDVDGLYTSDPNSASTKAACRFEQVSYRTALSVGGKVVQPKAIDFAEKFGLRFQVSCIGERRVTEVGPFRDRVAFTSKQATPLKVALLGCGTVGAGVFKRLTALPEHFEILAVGTRNVERAIADDVPEKLITTNLESAINENTDVVVELLGGTDPAKTLITKALGAGCKVVTANKAVLASDLKLTNDPSLRYSAAVGAVLPALETVTRAVRGGPIRSVEGILNGTTNFILDEIAKGKELAEAISSAQKLGYAETNPKLDLDGTDAAQKLILLARGAFGLNIPFDFIRRDTIEDIDVARVRKAASDDECIRVVAECLSDSGKVTASVRLVQLPSVHPLADVHGVENRLLVQSQNGQSWIAHGRGAGRWPTTESVIADLFDLRRESIEAVASSTEQECVA